MGLSGGFLLVASLMVAGAPASAAPGDEHLDGLEYVALGDSYAAGFGLTPLTGLPAIGCAQSSANYPHQVAAELGLALTDVTCTGATTDNLTTVDQVTLAGTAPVQNASLSATTDVVTVTIGGNDMNFADLMGSCAALSPTGPIVGESSNPFAFADCKSALAPSPGTDLLAGLIAGYVAPALNAALADIADKAPNAKIFVIGYPALTPATAPTVAPGCFTTAIGAGTPPFPVNSYPYTLVDVPYLHSVEVLLDQALAAAATANGATMVSLLDASSDHSPCEDPADAYVNGVTVTSLDLTAPIDVTFAPGTLHPNAAGAAFQAAQVESAIRAAFPAPAPAAPAGEQLAATGSDAGGWIALTGILLLLMGASTRRLGRVAARH